MKLIGTLLALGMILALGSCVIRVAVEVAGSIPR
jgi:hypothetical protein